MGFRGFQSKLKFSIKGSDRRNLWVPDTSLSQGRIIRDTKQRDRALDLRLRRSRSVNGVVGKMSESFSSGTGLGKDGPRRTPVSVSRDPKRDGIRR